MNSIGPILAPGCMEPSAGEAVAILSVLVAWWLSGLLMLINLLMAIFLKLPWHIKRANLISWSIYTVPWIILMLGLYGYLPLLQSPGVIGMVYVVAIPFITGAHFYYFLWMRRRLRAMRQTALHEAAV